MRRPHGRTLPVESLDTPKRLLRAYYFRSCRRDHTQLWKLERQGLYGSPGCVADDMAGNFGLSIHQRVRGTSEDATYGNRPDQGAGGLAVLGGSLVRSGTPGAFHEVLAEVARGCFTPEDVRKLCSILLLAIFSLAAVLPLLALGETGKTSLRACCLKNGEHHCVGSMGEGSESGQQTDRVGALRARCPRCPGVPAPAHSVGLSLQRAERISVSPMSHPTGVAQTESKRRMSLDRSRQKRGPPVGLPS